MLTIACLPSKLSRVLVGAAVLAGCASPVEEDASGASAAVSLAGYPAVASIEVVKELVPNEVPRLGKTFTSDIEYLRVKTDDAAVTRAVNSTLEDDAYVRVDGLDRRASDLREVQTVSWNRDGILSFAQRTTWADSDEVIVETRNFDLTQPRDRVDTGLRSYLDQDGVRSALAMCSDASRAKAIARDCALAHWTFEPNGLRFYSDAKGVLVPYAKLTGITDARVKALAGQGGPQ